MKKFLIVLLTILLVMACVGCGSVNTTSNNYSNDNYSSDEHTSSVESTVEDHKPHGIDGLVDQNATPAGKVYDGIDGPGFTTEFFDNYTCRATWIKTGELKDFDDWKFIGDGKIRKIYREDTSVYDDYFMYKNYLVELSANSGWGTLEGDSQNGYTNNKNNDGDRILREDGTYEYITKYWQYKGIYKTMDERVLFIDAKDERGDPFPIYLFIDNDNLLHYAYPEVK